MPLTPRPGSQLIPAIVLGAVLLAGSPSANARLLFMNFSATAGVNLDVDQQILPGGDNCLRRYPLRYQAGEGRWSFTAEQRFFTGWYPLQMFNVGRAVLYDMGGSWGRDALGASGAHRVQYLLETKKSF